MLELALLGLLSDQPLHGYELKKQLADVVGTRAGVSFGSLYPALSRLETNALVRTVDQAPASRAIPMTGSLGAEVAAVRTLRPPTVRSRRTRKVYAITVAGEQRLIELLLQPATDERTFQLQVAFCRRLTNAQRLDLFERRRADLARRSDDVAPGHATDNVDRLRDRYRRALHDREGAAILAELSWLEHLIADERELADDVPPGTGTAFAAASSPVTTIPSGGSTP